MVEIASTEVSSLHKHGLNLFDVLDASSRVGVKQKKIRCVPYHDVSCIA
jgi:hypothetical protein